MVIDGATVGGIYYFLAVFGRYEMSRERFNLETWKKFQIPCTTQIKVEGMSFSEPSPVMFTPDFFSFLSSNIACIQTKSNGGDLPRTSELACILQVYIAAISRWGCFSNTWRHSSFTVNMIWPDTGPWAPTLNTNEQTRCYRLHENWVYVPNPHRRHPMYSGQQSSPTLR